MQLGIRANATMIIVVMSNLLRMVVVVVVVVKNKTILKEGIAAKMNVAWVKKLLTVNHK